jgi:peptidyl-prolyl cis-trans isomerase SurA
MTMLSPRSISAALLALAVLAGLAMPVWAERAVATVDGRTITQAEVRERSRLIQIFDRRRPSARQALDELINDRLKIQEAARRGIRVPASMVEESIGRLARSNGGPSAFAQNLRSSNLDEGALRRKLEANIAWDGVMRAAARDAGRLSKAELEAALSRKQAEGGTTVSDYDLQSVVFVVPAGSGGGAREMAKARAARKAFSGCETGFAALRGLVDVAVKPAFSRSSADLPAETVKLLNATGIGKLSEPFATGEGIEMIAVCGKRDRQDLAAAREQIERESASKAIASQSEALLKDLRARAEITYNR